MKRNEALSVAALKKVRPGTILRGEGLKFERLPSGDGVFYVETQINRKRVHRVVGKESEGFTLTAARDALTSMRSRARDDVLSLPAARKTGMLFSELAAEYLKRMEAAEGKNLDTKRAQLELHLIQHFGAMPATSIDRDAFDAYRAKRVKQKVLKRERLTSHTTVNREQSTMTHLLNKAVEWKLLAGRPKLSPPRKEQENTRNALTVEQSAKLLASAEIDEDPDIFTFCMVALNTSARLTEILSIKVDHLDFDRMRLRVMKAKAGAREQPLTPLLTEHLHARIKRLGLKRGDWLFPSTVKRDGKTKSKSGRRMSVVSVWDRVVERAGLTADQIGHKLVRHSLRHSAITNVVKTGVDLQVVQKISGHKTLSMVMRYTHTRDDEVDVAMALLQERLNGAAKQPPPAAQRAATSEPASHSVEE